MLILLGSGWLFQHTLIKTICESTPYETFIAGSTPRAIGCIIVTMLSAVVVTGSQQSSHSPPEPALAASTFHC